MFRAKTFWVNLCGLFAIFYLAPAVALNPTNTSAVWRRARTLSTGQKVWSVQSAYRQTLSRQAHEIKTEPVSWGQLLDAEPEREGRIQLSRQILKSGLALEQSAASEIFEVNREEVSLHLDWAFGLTPDWMIGFQSPVDYRRTRIRSEVAISSDLAQTLGDGQSHSLRERVRELVENKIAEAGYERFSDEQEAWEIGDMNLLSQVRLHRDYRWEWSLQQLVSLPTARNPNLGDYFHLPTDAGNVDLGLTSLLDYKRSQFVLGTRFGLIAQLPDTYQSAQHGQRQHRRDLGDCAWGAIDGQYHLNSRLDISLEHSYTLKEKDHWEGAMPAVGSHSSSELQQTRLGLLYRLADRLVRSGVENQWVASLGYTQPWVGRESLGSSQTSIEIINYF